MSREFSSAPDSQCLQLTWPQFMDGESMYGLIGELTTPTMQDAIASGRPFIAGFETRIETEPIGGIGLG